MKDKVALITGASSGIGWSTAKAFAERGSKVVLAARRETELSQLATEIQQVGGQATYIPTDVSSSEQVQKMVDHTINTFGRLDYAINNAGIEGQFAPIFDLPDDQWEKVMDINLKGTFYCMKYQAKAMLANGNGGSIVNVGSVNSFLGFAGGSAYATSKHGMVGMTSSVSAELASQGIRVNIVCPGFIVTPMHHRVRDVVGDEMFEEYIGKVHQQRAGQPEEIASTILFLCSDDASYITGTTLTPDGGFTTTI
jgi:NAD(P)-dependent dehydrogenase (short-subunit alcohol dehydrogenase family)